MDENNPGSSLNRRNALKTLGAGVASLSVLGGVSSAKSQDKSDKIYQQALKVREKTGSVARYRQFLKNHGFGVATDDSAYIVGNSDVSTNYLDKADLEIYFTLSSGNCTSYDDNYYADINWKWSKDWDDQGETPRDQIGIRWDDTHLLLPNEGGDEYYSDNYEYNYCTNGGLCYSGQASQYSHSGGEGIVFGYMDRGSAADGNHHYGGCKLRKISDQDNQNIQLRGDYEHNWSSTVDSIGISYGGLTVTYADSGDHSWQVDRKQDGSGERIATNLSEADCHF